MFLSRFLQIILLSISLSLPVIITAQVNTDPKNVDVNKMSDAQIMQLMNEAQKRGLTVEQALSMAKAKGVSEAQIALFRKRMNEMKNGSTSKIAKAKELEIKKSDSFDSTYSTKAQINSSIKAKATFGFSLFNSEKLTFEPDINVPVSASYILGPGDEIIINIWGNSEQDFALTIDRNGEVIIPNVGTVNLGGIEYGDAKELLIGKLSQIYRDLSSAQPQTFATINIATVKAIKVNVIGDVFAPGTYTLPGTASAFNALYLCGGPNENGTFRDIQIIRNGKVLKHLDVYEYLVDGKTDANEPLRDNDVVFVPTYIKRVRIAGEVKRIGIYEAKESEKLSDLIRYSGGFTEDAFKERLELYRKNGKEKTFKDVLVADLNQITIEQGDSLYVGAILDRFQNRVSVRGAVFRPGMYEFTPNLTLKELLLKAEGPREDAFLQRALITRLNDDYTISNIAFSIPDVMSGKENITLKREDVVNISSIFEMREKQDVFVFGEIMMPGKFEFETGMSIADLVYKAGGLKESASDAVIEISRVLSPEENKTAQDRIANVFQISISRNLEINPQDAQFELKPFDAVFIRKAPGYQQRQSVILEGEINYTGSFVISSKTERISDIIKRAGGLKPDAFTKGAMLTRMRAKGNRAAELKRQMLLNDPNLVRVDREFDVVGIDLEKIMKDPGCKQDLFLMDGDELYIPKQLHTVEVTGNVQNSISSSFIPGKGLKYYVNQCGGFGERAKKGKVYVIYPNGTNAVRKGFIFKRNPKITAGSEIVVPSKAKKEPIPAAAWIGMASTMATIALTIATIANF